MTHFNINLAQAYGAVRDNGGYTHWNDGVSRDSGYVVGNNTTSLKLDMDEYTQVHHDVINVNRWLGQYGNNAQGVGMW